MEVGQPSGDGLQERRGHLEDQRDEADLGEREAEFLLEKRIDRRNDRLHHVVEQMRGADHQQDRIDRPARPAHFSRSFRHIWYEFTKFCHTAMIKIRQMFIEIFPENKFSNIRINPYETNEES